MEREYFSNLPVLEPACGRSCITEVLRKSGRFSSVEQYDLNHPVLLHRRNFYEETREFPYIITNPPYGAEVDKFVEKAKEICTEKFAFLLRTNYLSGIKRYNAGVYKGLSKVYVFTRMSDLRCPIRPDGRYETAGIVYAWFVWEKQCIRNPYIEWIDNQKYVLKVGE